MNKLLLGGVLAGGTFLAYKYFSGKGGTNGSKPLPGQKTVLANKVGLNNPAPQPRVDNSNQPWYGSAAGALGVPTTLSLNNFQSIISGGSSIIHSASDIFGTKDTETTFGEADEPITLNPYDSEMTTMDANDPGMGQLDTQPSGSSDNTEWAMA